MDQDWQEQIQKYDAAADDAEAAGKHTRYLCHRTLTDTCVKTVTGKPPVQPTKKNSRAWKRCARIYLGPWPSYVLRQKNCNGRTRSSRTKKSSFAKVTSSLNKRRADTERKVRVFDHLCASTLWVGHIIQYKRLWTKPRVFYLFATTNEVGSLARLKLPMECLYSREAQQGYTLYIWMSLSLLSSACLL